MKNDKILHVILPFFPPSLNKCYVGKEHFLSQEGKNFKTNSKGHIATTYLDEIGKFLKDHEENKSRYTLVVRLHSRWLTKTSGFYKRDISNYIKLVEDVFSESIGIDDKHNFRVILDKVDIGDEDPFVEILYYKPENEGLLNGS